MSDSIPQVDRASDHVQEPEWYVMEGMPGQGPRPDYLSSKYKSLADQAKAQRELEKMLGATAGAPEEYDLGEYKETIDSKNPHFQEFVTYAKQNRINQEAFTKVLDSFVKYGTSQAPNFDEEIAKLGQDGPRKIETVRQWADNNLSAKSLETIGKIAKTADVVELLDELRQFKHHEASQPPGNMDHNTDAFKPLTVKEVSAEMETNYKRYLNDKNYQEEIRRKFEQAVG